MASRKEKRPRPLPKVVRVVRARPRLFIAAMVGLIIVFLPLHWSLSTRLLVGWDVGACLYLVTVYQAMWQCGIDVIRRRAAQQDEGSFAILVLTTGAALASLIAIVAELGAVPASTRGAMQLALACGTIVLSWFFIHTIFALHYAHEYYGEHRPGGLKFPGSGEPDYWDFTYFSFVIGMTFQVSDVAVTSKAIRMTVVSHGIVSFFFDVALLALIVNIAAGALQGS
jgi:uncharacterized membrane protein